MNREEHQAYADGLTAGGKWFNHGIDKHEWTAPNNPFPKDSPEAVIWDRGLYEAFGDLEDAYYS